MLPYRAVAAASSPAGRLCQLIDSTFFVSYAYFSSLNAFLFPSVAAEMVQPCQPQVVDTAG
eukprot:scaffold251292_cov21-Prasinocladus_malaysianus.AAC.4